MAKPIVVYGAGGFAREVCALIDDINEHTHAWDLIGLLSDDPVFHSTIVSGYRVLGGRDWLRHSREPVAVALGIGSPASKRRVATSVEALGADLPCLVHPTAVRSASVRIGRGTIVCAGTIATVDTQIGAFVTINLACTIGHDCAVDDCATIAPGVNVSGNVHIGAGSDIGTGSAIIQGVEVGEWSIVGAGAVVARSLPANCTAVGVPAKVIKQREAGWHEN